MTKDAVEKFADDVWTIVHAADKEMRSKKTEEGMRRAYVRGLKKINAMRDQADNFDNSKQYGDDWPLGGKDYAVGCWQSAKKHLYGLKEMHERYFRHAYLAKTPLI